MLLPGLSSSTSPAEPQVKGKVTYIVDEGLVTFAKFSGAMLGIFILVGTYLFGIKLEVTVDKMGEAQRQLEKSEKDIESLRTTAATVQKQVEQAISQSATMLGEIERNRQASVLIITDLRTRALTPKETAVLDETRKASPEKFRGAASKLWPNGSTLRVKFLDGTKEQQEQFRHAIEQWLPYANLRVQYVDATEDAPIKVSFADPGSWSALGVEALATSRGIGATINLGYADTGSPPRNYLHEIGHLLGLQHEHQNPKAHLNWNRGAVYKILGDPPNNWDKPTVDRNLFDSVFYPGSREFDPKSIMLMTLPASFFKDGKGFDLPSGLSESDKQYIASLYPRE
jgi:hypothetical protein